MKLRVRSICWSNDSKDFFSWSRRECFDKKEKITELDPWKYQDGFAKLLKRAFFDPVIESILLKDRFTELNELNLWLSTHMLIHGARKVEN